MKIGFVCTNYNNTAYTREAVCSLLGQSKYQYSIVVVDNNSDVESVRALKELADEFQEVELVLNNNNEG